MVDKDKVFCGELEYEVYRRIAPLVLPGIISEITSATAPVGQARGKIRHLVIT